MLKKRILFFLFAPFSFHYLFANEIVAKSKQTSFSMEKISEKDLAEQNSYKKREPLTNPLAQIPNAGNRFENDTIYVMKNFYILKKISGGYLITTESGMRTSGNTISFGVAFLKTSKRLPRDILISSAVVYDGEFKYIATNDFEQKIPRLKIPANIPIMAIRRNGDPFAQEYF